MFGKKAKEVDITVRKECCIGCGECVERCRRGAMKLRYREDRAYAWCAYPDKCTGCGKCAKVCWRRAIDIKERSGAVVEKLNY